MNTTPIEFMALDKDSNRMYKPVRFYFGKEGSFVITTYSTLDAPEEHFEWDDMNGVYVPKERFDKFQLLQRTALRSINDEPIYNHMIVKDQHGLFYVIDMFKYIQMGVLSCLNLEIVGNRFQSPELLELCK